MPRLLSDAPNKLTLHDNISGSEIVLFYRNPTTQEMAGYHNESVTRKRKRVEFRQANAQLKYGERILLGFRDGDFVREENGQTKPMASDPDSPNYFEDWKAQVMKHAADLIMLMAAHVFNASAEVEEQDEPETGEDAEKN